MNRRYFLKTTTAAGALLGAAPSLIGQNPFGYYKTALVGCGWWGNNILTEAMAYKAPPPGGRNCRIVALSDADQAAMDKTLERVTTATGDKPRRYANYLDMLDREKPDIVIVATPDHWHALQMIESVKAGAHVFVEKPISHTVDEGRAMVRAARKYGRTVQVDFHRRVSPHNISGMKFLKDGKAGKIGFVRAFVHYDWARGRETPVANQEPPKGLDWDMWCGPARLRPYNKLITPRGFRQFLDYGNGMLGDWGVHWMDQILWWTEEKWPKRVSSSGGRPILGPAVDLPDFQTTDAPDSQAATFQFESFTAVWEHRLFGGNNAEKGENVGCYFYGTEGTFHMGWRNGWTFYPTDSSKPVVREAPQLNDPDQQNIRELWADFVQAIANNTTPLCDVENGYRATTTALLGMASLKSGRSLDWDAAKQTIVGDDYACGLLRRPYRPGYEYPIVP